MKTGKKVFIIVAVVIVAIVGVVGYYGYQMMNSTTETTSLTQVDTMTIKNEKTEIVLSGQVKTKDTKTEYYDLATYGTYWSTPVSVGQRVNEGDIIVESSKKDYKAPFSGYITEVNGQAAYDEAKKADKDNVMLTEPMVLYTIVSDDYFIETALTEYEVNRLPENKQVKYSIRAQNVDTYYDASIRNLSALPQTNTAAATGTTTKTDISNYTLTLNMDTGKENARVGNHVTIRISDANTPALTIPLTAVLKEDGKTYVYKYNKETNMVTKTSIDGVEENGVFKINSGLANSDVIVSSDVSSLTDGMLVQSKTALDQSTTVA